jgi:hypothetical protein
MTGSGAGAERKSAVRGRAAETDSGGDDDMLIPPVLTHYRQHASWGFIALP